VEANFRGNGNMNGEVKRERMFVNDR